MQPIGCIGEQAGQHPMVMVPVSGSVSGQPVLVQAGLYATGSPPQQAERSPSYGRGQYVRLNEEFD